MENKEKEVPKDTSDFLSILEIKFPDPEPLTWSEAIKLILTKTIRVTKNGTSYLLSLRRYEEIIPFYNNNKHLLDDFFSNRKPGRGGVAEFVNRYELFEQKNEIGDAKKERDARFLLSLLPIIHNNAQHVYTPIHTVTPDGESRYYQRKWNKHVIENLYYTQQCTFISYGIQNIQCSQYGKERSIRCSKCKCIMAKEISCKYHFKHYGEYPCWDCLSGEYT